MTRTVAVGSFFIECNHLGGAPADLDSFRRSELDFGDALLTRTGGTVGGMLQTLRESSEPVQIMPLLVASACPSGPVTAECYSHLKAEMLRRLREAGPVDGVLLALHGSAAAENAGDLEGDLLAAVRTQVGADVAVVGSLDLHAHVTQQMVDAADVLVAWETYPHRDAFETGVRAARAVLDILAGRLKPTMALSKVPVLVSGFMGHTEGEGPFADVMRLAKSFEQRPGVYSTSAYLVHPYLDLPDMGGGGLVVTNNDPALARRLADEIAQLYWERRFDLEPETYSAAEAVARGLALGEAPVVLVETSDCCGGGAAGDSAASLKALLNAGVAERCLVPVVDPAAAQACHAAREGAVITLSLGHHIDSKWGEPITLTGTVEHLSDGQFTYRGGIWDGQPGRMGPSARFAVGGIQIAIASHATYEWLGEQYDLLGMDARTARFVVVKNPMNYRMAFAPIAKACFLLDTPGPTPPTLKNVRYRNVQRPYFPADDLQDWKPIATDQ